MPRTSDGCSTTGRVDGACRGRAVINVTAAVKPASMHCMRSLYVRRQRPAISGGRLAGRQPTLDEFLQQAAMTARFPFALAGAKKRQGFAAGDAFGEGVDRGGLLLHLAEVGGA